MDSQGLWRQILLEKCPLDGLGLKVPMPTHQASGMWKSIMSVKSSLKIVFSISLIMV